MNQPDPKLIKIQNALNTIMFALQVISEEVNRLIEENRILKEKLKQDEERIRQLSDELAKVKKLEVETK